MVLKTGNCISRKDREIERERERERERGGREKERNRWRLREKGVKRYCVIKKDREIG